MLLFYSSTQQGEPDTVSTRTSLLLVSGLVLLFTPMASASWAQDAFNPITTANESDVIVHGTVVEIQDSGGTPTPMHDTTHPVTLDIHEVIKGNVSGDHLTIQVGGGGGVWISTAASFSMDEEVILLLQQHQSTASSQPIYYLTSGQPGKYTVTNGTVQITEPVTKRITVKDIKQLLREPTTTNLTALPTVNISRQYTPPDATRPATDGGPGIIGQIIQAILQFLP